MGQVPAVAPLHDSGTPLTQRVMSQAIDTRSSSELAASTTLAHRAHLSLITAEGAGLWLHADPPVAAGLNTDLSVYVGMLRWWSRLPFA